MEQLLALLAALYMLLTAGEIEETSTVSENEAATDTDVLEPYACYVVKLKDIIKFPDNYWGLWSSINITEQNQFAIEDINGDGVEELLVKYNSAAADREEEFQYIDIYSYNELMNTIMAQEVEFYTDGTIIDIYTSEYRRSDTYIYENFELTNQVMILDKNKIEYSIQLDFPEEEDTDGDGVVHIWYEEPDNIPVEEQYISEEEYQERLAVIRRGKEQVDITWYQITEENLEKYICNDYQVVQEYKELNE